MLPESFSGIHSDMTEQLLVIWGLIKAPIIVPLLNMGVLVCLSMSVMLFIERLYMGVVITFVKIFGRKPDKRYKWEALKDDLEHGNSAYPIVLIQIPMFNEREVYQLSIGAACGLSWPSDRFIVQVLDDSTDSTIKVCWIVNTSISLSQVLYLYSDTNIQLNRIWWRGSASDGRAKGSTSNTKSGTTGLDTKPEP